MKNQKGFTLVELIVVIVIIGILAAVAVPKLMNLTGSAQITACTQNRMNMISEAQADYANDLALGTAGAATMEGWYGDGSSVGANNTDYTTKYTCPDGASTYTVVWLNGNLDNITCTNGAHAVVGN